MNRRLFTALIAGCTLLPVAGFALADGNQFPAPKLAFDSQFSPRLKATFVIRTFQLPGTNQFRAVRLTSDPEFGSPLQTLGLRQGDVITRLDGIPVTNFAELENHFAQTTVRFIRQGTVQVQNGTIFIDTTGNNAGGSNIELP